jgi:hypothetical protein
VTEKSSRSLRQICVSPEATRNEYNILAKKNLKERSFFVE